MSAHGARSRSNGLPGNETMDLDPNKIDDAVGAFVDQAGKDVTQHWHLLASNCRIILPIVLSRFAPPTSRQA